MQRYLIALVVSLVFTGILYGVFWILSSQLPDHQTFRDFGREVTPKEMLVIGLVDALLTYGWALALLCFIVSFAVAAMIGTPKSRQSETASGSSLSRLENRS